MRKTILLIALLCLPFLAFAQGNGPITIHGRLVDAEYNEPLIGASILEEGTTNGTVTDIDGKFIITVSSMEAKLKATYPDFQNLTFKVGNDKVIIMNEVEGFKPRKERENIELTDDDRVVVHGINTFSFKLLNVLDKQKSIVTSPLSIACLLSIINKGAAGKTRMEICKMLDCTLKTANSFYWKMIPFLTDSQYGSKFNMANALFVDPQFRLRWDFRWEAGVNSGAFVGQGVDVKNVKEVNDWCARQTNGMIPSMMDSQPVGASFVGLNAACFESLWEADFDVEETEDDYFTNEDGKKKKMPMMHQERAFPYAKGKNFSVMSMPYKGEVKYAISFLLPDEGYKLHQVLGRLNEERWQNIQRKMTGYIVDVKLPRFKTDADIQLIPVMKELGMQSAFDSNLADFRNLASTSNTFLSEMKQKSAIELNEKGTKAAVVTMEDVVVGCAGKRSKIKYCDFHATRPFAYVISEVSTGTIIFVGTYYGE